MEHRGILGGMNGQVVLPHHQVAVHQAVQVLHLHLNHLLAVHHHLIINGTVLIQVTGNQPIRLLVVLGQILKELMMEMIILLQVKYVMQVLI